MSNKVIDVRELTKIIGRKKIVDSISLEIFSGEVLGLLGPNGAGKTTLIKMILGLVRMTSGNIYINGMNVSLDKNNALKKVGAIVETPRFYNFLTGFENLTQYSRMYKEIHTDRIKEVVRLVRLQESINDKVKTYSLGMRQRLGIAQSLLHYPNVLILDEPTNGLDPTGVREFRNYIRDLAKIENISVMVSSHLLTEMELLCDRVAFIQSGTLICVEETQHFNRVKEELTLFEVDNLSLSYTLLSNKYHKYLDTIAKMDSNTIGIKITKTEVPDIANFLISNDVKLYEIRIQKETLEDRYMELTGGNGLIV